MRIPETEPPVFCKPESDEQAFLVQSYGVAVTELPETTHNGAGMVRIQAVDHGDSIFEYDVTVGGLNRGIRAGRLGGVVVSAQARLDKHLGPDPSSKRERPELKKLSAAGLNVLHERLLQEIESANTSA